MWYDVVSAISNLVMAAFAVIAGIYAKGQYDEAKQQRELALRQEQEERRKEAKQDELALQQQQQHERELIEARNRALFLERQREIAHVEAFAVKNGGNYAVELSVPTEASIYEVKVWAQWPDEDFSYDNAAGNRDSSRDGNPHVAPGKNRPWRMIRPGNWLVSTTHTYPWTQPEPVSADASAWTPVYADEQHKVVELEFTDCYGNKWRRCYGRNKEGQYVQSFVLIAAQEPELADYV